MGGRPDYQGTAATVPNIGPDSLVQSLGFGAYSTQTQSSETANGERLVEQAADPDELLSSTPSPATWAKRGDKLAARPTLEIKGLNWRAQSSPVWSPFITEVRREVGLQ